LLFNSYIFIFVFLPITLFIYFLIGSFKCHRIALAWLVASSLFFYAWWNPLNLGLILGSILFNYSLGLALSRTSKNVSILQRKIIFIIGVSANVGLLIYYKYANFFISSINDSFKTHFYIEHVVLPLAISFFTFTQITYLVDAFQRKTREYDFLQYCLFVLFFPHLIAGPILHHKEIIPQFERPLVCRFNVKHLSVGLTLFFIGLFKKVVVADGVAHYVQPVFDVASQGQALTFFEAWGGALCYTFQIYFDFSGYSDMAVGLGRMFGIRLPINFNSPYKAVNIIDFWRRWHISLSRLLMNYLYIPLGGNRKGEFRRYANLMITMLVGGLWHGAGWTFVVWGGLHGGYLMINNAWHSLRKILGHDLSKSTWLGRALSRLVTFIAVVIAWVFFRADSMKTAKDFLWAMVGGNGVLLWDTYRGFLNKVGGIGDKLAAMGWKFGLMDFFEKEEFLVIFSLLLAVWLLPNSQQIMGRYRPGIDISRGTKIDLSYRWGSWQPTVIWAIITAILAIITTSGFLSNVSEFLYFQF